MLFMKMWEHWGNWIEFNDKFLKNLRFNIEYVINKTKAFCQVSLFKLRKRQIFEGCFVAKTLYEIVRSVV